MKCDKCNMNEANIYYKAVVNGVMTQIHLCADCAMEEGLGNGANIGNLMFEGMLDSFFAMLPGMRSGLSGSGDSGYGLKASGRSIPKIDLATGAGIPQRPGNAIFIPADAGEEIKSKRELTALKYQLDTAVKTEDFEKAAKIRDRIREIEK